MSLYRNFNVSEVFNMPDAPANMTVTGYVDDTNPFIPKIDFNYVFRKDFLREVLAFLRFPAKDSLFVTGPTGSGKTSGITEIAARLNWPVQQITTHGHIELTDLVGHYAFIASQPGDAPAMQFVYGPLARAMRDGHILLINELDLADPAEVAGLNDILEGRALVIAQNGGEIIEPHPMFRFIATGNSCGAGDTSGLYQGVMMQNLAAMDRFRFTKVAYADEAQELQILERITPQIPEVIRKAMVRLANEMRRLFIGENGESGKISLPISTRGLVRWANLVCDFRGSPNRMEYALEQALLARAVPEDRTAILRLANDIFGDLW